MLTIDWALLNAPQIEFLELRLAEVMAYADIPATMRPALSDIASGQAFGQLGGAGDKSKQLQALRAALQEASKQLKEVNTGDHLLPPPLATCTVMHWLPGQYAPMPSPQSGCCSREVAIVLIWCACCLQVK